MKISCRHLLVGLLLILLARPALSQDWVSFDNDAGEEGTDEPESDSIVVSNRNVFQGEGIPVPEPAQAGTDAPSLNDADVNERLNAMQSEIDFLKSEQSNGLNPNRARSSDLPPPGSKTLSDALKLPAYPIIKLTGFFQEDTAFFSQDVGNTAQLGNIQDQTGFRRARLAAVGDVTENVSYMLEMDFAFPGRPSFMDVWVDVHSIPWLGNVRVGQWRQPFGLDNLTSVRELTFLERPLSFAFTPFRQTGIGFYNWNHDKTISWFGSVFKNATDAFGDNFGDKGYGLAGRLTGLPVYVDDGNFLVHVGGEYVLTHPSSGTTQYRAQPEFGGAFNGPTGTGFSVPFYVDTGAMAASTSNLFNAEVAAVCGSFHCQSELTYAVVSQNAGGTTTFPAYTAQAAYLLTGEVRPYNRNNAVLGRIKPLCPFGKDGGLGAWEIASRWSYIDLNAGGVNGGRLNDYTAGLNWYLNSNTKFQLNYIRSLLAGLPTGHSESSTVAVRAQVDF